ncbi:MAG: caspase family protein [Leptolyngbya sp. SIO1E4]|nr:caspase family protein [Leptolyngbya sp. SIO1E4]
MANQWALLIGINQYTALQPLMYAQADAVALRNFFVDELGIPIEQCILLTDLSAAVEPYAHYPLRKDIEAQLQDFCRQKVQPGDLLWVFFSGYGLATMGQDYWMPIDADPTQLAETAIAVSTVFDILKTAKTDQILLVLDINRSQGAIGHQNIGQQTLTLANDFGVATLMSCQPDQYAHETMAVRHGLFTKALLEGLRYHGCITVSQLAAYLSDRVPELSQHHWRPVQNPVTALPPERKFMMVVPAESIAQLPVTETAVTDFREGAGLPDLSVAAASAPPSTAPPSPPPSSQLPTPTPSTPPPVPPADLSAPQPEPTSSSAASSAASQPPVTPPVTPPSTGAIVHKPSDAEAEKGVSLKSLWKWGLIAAGIAFIVGALARYRPLGLLGGVEQAGAPRSTETSPAVPNAPPEGTTEGGETAEGEALFPNTVDPIAAGESALQRAEGAIAEGRYGEARAWLTQVPPELQTETYNDLLQQANSEVAEAAVRNQGILNDARQLIQPASASLFNDAIQQARQVPPEDPYYEQAQADIERWSRVILDLAEGRAASGDIPGAIAAAGLVPDDRPAVYQLAQQRIAIWQQTLENQQLIQQMQNSLQPGQASSFQDAIRALQQITPDQPGYSIAQERINQWSQDILAISRARAAQGRLDAAIAAATLVPEGTVAYEQAQQEIQRWQEQL